MEISFGDLFANFEVVSVFAIFISNAQSLLSYDPFDDLQIYLCYFCLYRQLFASLVSYDSLRDQKVIFITFFTSLRININLHYQCYCQQNWARAYIVVVQRFVHLQWEPGSFSSVWLVVYHLLQLFISSVCRLSYYSMPVDSFGVCHYNKFYSLCSLWCRWYQPPSLTFIKFSDAVECISLLDTVWGLV